jgi:hypothetical protein
VTPRIHNITSYTVALLVLPAVVLARGAGAMEFEFGTWLAVGLWCIHFSRRALEAAWLHRYSKPSFPLTDALIEYVYYWGFGTWIGWSLSTPSAPIPVAALAGGTILFVLGELGNNNLGRAARARSRPAHGQGGRTTQGDLASLPGMSLLLAGTAAGADGYLAVPVAARSSCVASGRKSSLWCDG